MKVPHLSRFAIIGFTMTKEVPQIPGVERGANFFKDKPVEMAGQELASRRRVEFGEKPLDLCLIKTADALYLNYPYLGRDETSEESAKLWEPRVSSRDGSVITWRWKDPNPDRQEFSDYIAFAGRKLDEKFNYSQVSTTWSKSILVPQVIKEGIEKAMRQQNEVAHDYRELEAEGARISETFDLLFESSSAFAVGNISQSELNGLAREAEKTFKAHGLLQSRDSIWQRVVKFTLDAMENDRRGRINPLVSRVRARAAFLAATEREMIGRSVGTKAEKVYERLAIVRAGIRADIEIATEVLDTICGFSGLVVADNEVMREGKTTCTEEEAREIRRTLAVVSGDILGRVQPEPYLTLVISARSVLMGEKVYGNDKEKAAILGILSKTGYASFLKDSAADRLEQHLPRVAERRIFLAYSLLKRSLWDKKTGDTRVFN